jgi:FkbM family methyltransferase
MDINIFARLNKLIVSAKCLLHTINNKSESPILLDIGARGGVTQPWRLLARFGFVNVIGFEPDNQEVKRLNLKYPFIEILRVALGEEDLEVPFYITVSDSCSSCLKPNFKVLDQYHLDQEFRVKQITKIHTKRLDDLVKEKILPMPDYLKIDVQGFEYNILKGAENSLSTSILAIELETHLKQLYENQHTFFDIIRYLGEFGFILCDFKPQGQRKFAGEIVEANCFFIKKDTKEKIDMRKKALWMKAHSIVAS